MLAWTTFDYFVDECRGISHAHLLFFIIFWGDVIAWQIHSKRIANSTSFLILSNISFSLCCHLSTKQYPAHL